MAINLHCPKCKSDSKTGTKLCKKCGYKFTMHNNKKYRVIVKTHSGKRIAKIVPTLQLAYVLEAKIRTESFEKEVLNINNSPVMFEVWSKYIEWAKINKKSWESDVQRWNDFIAPVLKDKQMDEIKAHDIELVLNKMRCFNSRLGKPYAPQTIKHLLNLQKRIFNWAISRDLYDGTNPCLKVRPPKFDNRINNPLSKKDLEKLMTVLESWENRRGVLVVKFALYTGKRRGEILSLKWDDIDLENRLMKFHGFNTKSGKGQALPMSGKAFEVILEAIKLRNCEHVFSSQQGEPYDPKGFYSIWRRIRRRADISYRFHDLRHTYASYLASSGKVDIYTLKELLGHSTVEMTQRYAHLINGALQKAVDVVDEVF